MTSAHLICRDSLNLHCIDKGKQIYESGVWNTVSVSEDDAKRLVGGTLYLHKKKTELSYFGGTVLGYRLAERSGDRARIDGWVFTVQSTREGKKASWSKAGRHDPNAHYSGVID